uniref:RecA family profile 1 domain-containing protein n=1 Tax=Pseudo-nitzschia australis TaxID=44445 RepID=A0A7S4EQW2_9STRA
MSASHRKISRLPLSVFQHLITRPPLDGREDDPETLKANICKRLKGFRVRNSARDRNNNKKRNRGGGSGISSPATTTRSIKTIGQLLRLSKYTLMVALDPILTYEEVGILLNRVCKQCAPKPLSVLALYRATTSNTNADLNVSNYRDDGKQNDADPVSFGSQMRHLPTSLPSLDRILCGGVRLATVTELVGRSGIGKTQLAFQLCVTAAKFNQGAIYIDTEKKLSLERLGEMSEQRRMSGNNYENKDEDAMGTFKPAQFVLNNLTLHQPGTSDELLEVLDALEYEILIRNQNAGQAFLKSRTSVGNNTNSVNNAVRGKYPVRLLILDSIAAPMRRDFGTDSAPQRAAAIFQCAQKLKRLADQLHLAVVVINQVGGSGGESSGTMDHSRDSGINNFGIAGVSSEQQQIPVRAALGTSWHHCVSTRLLLESTFVDDFHALPKFSSVGNDKHDGFNSREAVYPTPRVTKKIAVVKSNRTAFGETRFTIKTIGIVDD